MSSAPAVMRLWLIPFIGIVLQASCRGKDTGGQQLRILSRDWPQAKVEKRLAKEIFSPRTGIGVTYEFLPQDASEEAFLRAYGNSPEGYDIICYDSQWLARLAQSGTLARLDRPEFLQEAKCPLKFDDFMPSVSHTLGMHPVSALDIFAGNYTPYRDAAIFGLPWAVSVKVLTWRKDHMERAGIPVPPQTWEDFLNAARKLNAPPARNGAVIPAACREDCLLLSFLPIMWSFGGEIWNPGDCRITGILDGPLNVEALEFFAGWAKRHRIINANCTQWDEAESLAALAQGKASMGFIWSALADWLEDAGKSKAAGKLAYAQLPGRLDRRTGKIRRVTVSNCQGIGIVSSSGRKEEAWTYLMWLFATETQQAMTDAPDSGFISARHELSPYTASRNPRARAALDSLTFARDMPHEAAIIGLLPAIQREIHSAFSGRVNPRRALETAAREAQAALGPDCTRSTPKE